jgi:AbrB family looped-hinge helix DNA binding protein
MVYSILNDRILQRWQMGVMSTRITQGGRVVIPAEYRRALGLEEGDEVILRLVDSELRITGRSEAIRKAQAVVRKHVPRGKSLVRELIRERRRESAGE